MKRLFEVRGNVLGADEKGCPIGYNIVADDAVSALREAEYKTKTDYDNTVTIVFDSVRPVYAVHSIV